MSKIKNYHWAALSINICQVLQVEGKSINAAWGVMEKFEIIALKRRLYLLDVLPKSEALYDVEIWR